MPTPHVMHADNPQEVANQMVVDADLGVDNRRLLVISGIGIYGWLIDTDETAVGEIEIRTGIFARDFEQGSVFVGLASIGNDDSEFVFAVDRATVQLDPNTGELYVHAHTALMGEWSSFNRIAYQIVATVQRIGAFIEGTISWPASLHRPPSNDPSTIAPSISVVANQHELIPSTQQGMIFGSSMVEKLTPKMPGAIHSLTVGRSECKASYRIDNPPMGMPLKVMLTLSGVFPPATYWAQTTQPYVFTLSPTNPSETVDFALGTTIVVK